MRICSVQAYDHAGMKLGCNSHSYARMLAAGELTQLEWVDWCAHELALDGLEFAGAHFPRRDDDYLAQLKKLCVDRCLTVAAYYHDTPFDSADTDTHVPALARAIEIAVAIGAPIVRFGCADVSASPGIAWRELIRGLKSICIDAKIRNVTLALQPRPQSLIVTPADARRAQKECDSAWLRLALSAEHLAGEHHDEWTAALEEVTIVSAPMLQLDTFGADETIDYISVLTQLWQHPYRGFLSLEYRGAEDESAAVKSSVLWLRGMLAKDALKSAATLPVG